MARIAKPVGRCLSDRIAPFEIGSNPAMGVPFNCTSVKPVIDCPAGGGVLATVKLQAELYALLPAEFFADALQ